MGANSFSKYYIVSKAMRTVQPKYGYVHHIRRQVDETVTPVTSKRLRSSFSHSNVTLYDTFELARNAIPSFDNDNECSYATAIYQVYLCDEGKISKTAEQHQTTPYSNVIFHKLSKFVVRCWSVSKCPTYYPRSYLSIFTGNNETSPLIYSIKILFNDYSHPKCGLFLTGHWNRHHTKLANTIVEGMPADPREAHAYLLDKRENLINVSKNLNLDGSFMRRMNFALAKLCEHSEVNDMAKSVEGTITPNF